LAYPKNYEGALTVIGENGLVKIGGMAVNKIEKWEFKDYHDMDKEIMVSNYEPKNEYGNGHVSFYKKVISHLRGINSSFVDGFEGRKSLEIIMAIYKSAETSQKIFI
jgi:UDP-N-acetyl-2-amino-2-deoxyglucuronate dehydrogenase